MMPSGYSSPILCSGLDQGYKIGDRYLQDSYVLLQNIRENPNNAYMHAHYGHFLERHERYDEAIRYFEKAVELKPYLNAIESLERVRRKMTTK